MTITRLFEWGFGCDGSNSHLMEPTGVISANVSSNMVCEADTIFGRRYGAQRFSTSEYLYHAVATPTRQLRLGTWAFHQDNWTFAATTTTLINLRDGSNNSLVSIKQTASTTDSVSVYTASTNRGSAVCWTGLTARGKHWGLDLKIDSSAGWVAFYADGVRKVLFEGNTGNADIAYVDVGIVDNPATNSDKAYFAHVYCDDTTGEASYAPVPSLRFDWVAYSADGNYKDFTPSSGTDHKALIDEVPSNLTDYNAATAADKIDSFTHAAYTVPVGGTIQAALPGVIALKSDAAIGSQIAGFARLATTDVGGTQMDLGTGYKWLRSRMTTKPGGGAWTGTDFNNAEFGYKSGGAFS